MASLILQYKIDWILSAGAALFGLFAADFLLRRRTKGRSRFHISIWITVLVILAIGFFFADHSQKNEASRLRGMFTAFAGTYAMEIQEHGHENITLRTDPRDNMYLYFIEMEKRWLKVNPEINDVYTMTRDEQGKLRFLVDSETDYDRNGWLEGERESRTPIGEEYDEGGEYFDRAFKGETVFDSVPYTDRWGTWVSAYAPIFDSDKRVHAIVGVDYDAGNWVSLLTYARLSSLLFIEIFLVFFIATILIVFLTRNEVKVQKEIESVLRESESRFRVLADAAPILMWMSDVDKKCTFFNQTWLKFRGREMEQETGDGWSEGVHPDDLKHCLQVYQSFFDARQRFSMEYRLKRYDNVYRWVLDEGVPRYGSEGEFQGYIGGCIDISERKENEERLQKFMRAVQQSSNCIIITDNDGVIEYVNPTFEKVTGHQASEVIGKTPRILKSGKTSLETYQDLWQTIKAGNDWRGELLNRGKQGLYWAYLTISPMRDERGGISHFVAIQDDITDRKRYEEELRTSKKEAEDASRAKSSFLANMSHEIRTPLNAIVGFSDLLKKTSLTEAQTDYLETITESSEALLGVINDILDVSKIESGRLNFESIQFDLHYLLDSVMKIGKTSVKEKQLEFYFYYPPHVPRYFIGDPTRIRQIYLNLVNNAIKFTEHGEIGLSVNLKDSNGNKHLIEIVVKDTGIGIPKDKQQVIFEAFSQADVSTTRKYGGTGLGLTIVKRLLKAMDGDVEIRSEPGKGSEFITRFYIEETAPIQKDFAASHWQEVLRGKTFMVVDDNKTARQIIDVYCSDAGMKSVNTSASVHEATKFLDSASVIPDVILSDVLMPDENGYQFAKRIRSVSRFNSIRLIAITSDAVPGSASEARKAGFDGYLPKPIGRDDLLKVMAVVFKKSEPQSTFLITKHAVREASPLLGARILVVEDNAVNRKLIKILLEELGCDSDLCANGQEAVEKIKASTYQACLMDLQMPVMGGLEAAEIIRKDLRSGIPIIALTAAVLSSDQEKCMSVGMNDFIAKPIKPKILEELLIKWVQKKI